MSRIIRGQGARSKTLSGFVARRRAGKLRIGGHIGWQQVELLHLGSPGNHLRAVEQTGVIESADLDEHRAGRTLGARGKMDSATVTEVPYRPPRMVLVGERSRGSAGKLKRTGVHCGEEISCAARNHL